METITKRPTHCPTCSSPSPARFPATAFEGEALACANDWHLTDPRYPPSTEMQALVERGKRNEAARAT